jgi:LytS/YehU family sensor histidine kinase
MIGFSMFFFRNYAVLKSLNIALSLSLYLVAAEIGFTTVIVYWLIPRFFQRSKILFSFMLVTLSVVLIIVEAPAYIRWFMLEDLPKNSFTLFWECFTTIMGMSHVVCLLFIAIRLYIHYYLKMQERELLISENISAQIQLLKAQVHPHFLFNTLNNIYSFALNKSPESSSLVLKLSGILKYMANDCRDSNVPLRDELKMICDYIGLEKVRYGKRLTLNLKIEGNDQHKLIAPLLLIPLVENSFKHGAGKSLTPSWINIKITIGEEMLCMKIANSKPLETFPDNRRGSIGLDNLKKRLKLIYSDRHKLNITSLRGKYFASIQIPFESSENRKSLKQTIY